MAAHKMNGANRDRLNPGEKLIPGDSLVSPNGRYRLTMQCDENLVLYDGDRAKAFEPRKKNLQGGRSYWASNTHDDGCWWKGRAEMQFDGNLVVYNERGKPKWGSGSETDFHTTPGSKLVIQDDGNLVTYAPDGHPVWSSGMSNEKRSGGLVKWAVGAVGTAGKIAHDVTGTALSVVNTVAPFIQGTLSMVPVLGQAASSYLGVILAVVNGDDPIDIAVKAAYGFIPIPPGIRSVTDIVLSVSLKLAHNPHLDKAAIQVARDQVPKGIPRDVFDSLVAVIAGHNLMQEGAKIVGADSILSAASSVLPKTPAALSGFNAGIAMMNGKTDRSQFGTLRKGMKGEMLKGFDTAVSMHKGRVKVKAPPAMTAKQKAGFYLLHGVRHATEAQRVAIAKEVVKDPEMREGAQTALTEMKNESWWTKLLRFFHLHD